MQVNVEKKEGIKCDLEITVDANNIDSEVNKRLQKLSKTAKIDGFRPGKVPMSFLRKRHGKQVRAEVLNDIIPKHYMQAIEDEKLKAAGVNIEMKTDEPGKDLEFTAHVELFPEFEVQGVNELEIEKPVAQVGDAEIEKMILNLRKQVATWHPVDGEGAQNEDRVNLSFKGTVDGETFEGGSAENQSIVIGSGQMIPGFEEGMIGVKAGEEKTIQVTFPEDYQKSDLAGKTAEFVLNVHEVERPELPELNEELVKQFGVEGSVDEFMEEIEANMNRELKAAVNKKLKEQVFEGLKQANEVEVPDSLIKQEIQRSKEDFIKRMGQQAGNQFDVSQLPDNLFESAAKDRVKSGLIINKLIEEQAIEATQDKIDAKIEEYASVYEDPTEVRAHFRQNPQELESLKASIVEDELVDWVVSQAVVNEKEADFFELVKSASNNQPAV